MNKKNTFCHIALIDDDKDDHAIFKMAINGINTKVFVSYFFSCSDFIMALKTMAKFDIIFLDINMPRKNGNICLEMIQTTHQKNTPVIIYSTTDNEAMVKKLLDSGAAGHIKKPPSIFELQQLLEKAISRFYPIH